MCYNNMNILSDKAGPSMKIIPIHVGDVLELKKPHPCGEKHFKVLRTGSEVRIVCVGCGRDMVLERLKLEKAVKTVISAEAQP